jgi:post-segregation antitoxin (ccd killing protein)
MHVIYSILHKGIYLYAKSLSMNSERICVTLPIGLPKRAHDAGINISAVAASAVLRTTEAIEKETGEDCQVQTPAAASVRRASECQPQMS